MIPATSSRVERNTASDINRARQDEIEQSLRYYAARPREVPARLAELDREWDIERALQANASTMALTGVALGAFVDRRFLLLPAAVAGFLLQHAVQGWCPPLPLLRRIGFRTSTEICEERCGLKMLSGNACSVAEPPIARWQAETEELDEAVDA